MIVQRKIQVNIKGISKKKSYIGTPVKYYFMDLGLRNARINYGRWK